MPIKECQFDSLENVLYGKVKNFFPQDCGIKNYVTMSIQILPAEDGTILFSNLSTARVALAF